MKTYINITNYMSGASVREQVNELLTAGKIDKDTRLFFSKNNSLTTKVIAQLVGYFDIDTDCDFDRDNIVFIPRDYILSRAEAKEKW